VFTREDLGNGVLELQEGELTRDSAYASLVWLIQLYMETSGYADWTYILGAKFLWLWRRIVVEVMSTLFVMQLDLRDFFLLRAEEIIVRTGRKNMGGQKFPYQQLHGK
jgi:hypothetical protein